MRLADERDRRRTLLALTPEAEAILNGMARTHLEELRRIQPALIELVERFGGTAPGTAWPFGPAGERAFRRQDIIFGGRRAMPRNKAPQTVAAANGIGADRAFGAVAPPIHLTSTYTFEGFDRARTYDYSRAGNPTREVLADTLAQLEAGAGAVVVSSGMAAIDLALSRAEPGDLVVAPHDCYAGTWRLLGARRAKRQLDVAFIDQADDGALASVLARSPKLILIESPSNPVMRVVDIRRIAARAKAAGARVVVDNTFLSPALQRPITLGADVVVHSTTSTSTAIPTWSAAQSSRRTGRTPRSSRPGRTPRA